MKKQLLFGAIGICSLFVLASCGGTNSDGNSGGDSSKEDLDSSKDDFKITTEVVSGYTFDEANHVYTITKAGEYDLSGTLHGTVSCSDSLAEKVTLNLMGVTIITDESAIVWNSENSKVEIKAKKDYTNSLTTIANSKKENNTISSKNNIEIGGKGTLNVVNKQKHAISGSEVTVGSEVKLNITADVKDGIHGKQVIINGGVTSITAKGDAIQAEVNKKGNKGNIIISGGTLNISKTLTAFKADTDVTFQTGEYEINVSLTDVTEPFDSPIVKNTATSVTYKENGTAKEIPTT